MLDAWACEKQKPKHSEYVDLGKCCKAVQNHIELELSAGRKYSRIKETRMFLSHLDNEDLLPVAHALKKELRGLMHNENHIAHNLKLMMLPGTISNHDLISSPPNLFTTTNNLSTQNVAQINSLLDFSSSNTDEDDFIVNAFRNFNNSKQINQNHYQQ